MPSDEAIYLDKQDRRILQELIRKGRAGNGSRRPTPTRRQPRGSGITGNVIRATVNAPGGVVGVDFPFDNAVAIVGSAPSGGVGVANNLYTQDYADNDVVILFQRKDTGVWDTERGGTAGSQVIYAELVEDKSYADYAKLAKPVDSVGVIISGADPFYLLDEQSQFFGLAAYDFQRGYRYHAVKLFDSFLPDGGDPEDTWPAYRIIDGEGPAQIVLVELSESYSMSGTHCTPLDQEPFGRADQGRLVFSEEEGATAGDIFVQDPLNVASAAENGDRWIVLWDEAAEQYEFLMPIDPPLVLAIAQVNQSGGVAHDDADFPIDSITPQNGSASPTGNAVNTLDLQLADNQELIVIRKSNGDWFPLHTYDTAIVEVTSGISARSGTYTWGSGVGTILKKTGTGTHSATGGIAGVTIYNSTLHTAADDDVIQVKRIDGEWFWDVADCETE
jgi:hypothetical protein